MRTMLAGIALAVGVVSIAGCTGNGDGMWDGFTPPEVLAESDLQYYWDIRLPLEGDETIQRLFLLDERLYALSSDNRLFAVDAARGLWDWTVRVAPPEDTVFEPVHADDMVLPAEPIGVMEIMRRVETEMPEPMDAVLINSLQRLLVIDRDDGSIVRDIELGFAANTGGDTDGQRYYVGDTRGWFHCIRLAPAVRAWTLTTEDMLSAPLVCHGDAVYVGGEDGKFYSAAASNERNLLWSRTTTGPITTAFHVDDRGCFVPSEDNRIYAFDPAGGQSLWDVPFVCEGPLRDPIQVGENTIFQYAERDRFYAIRLTDGSPRWSLPEGRRVLAVMDGQAYVIDAGGRLQVRDEVTGELDRSVELRGFSLFADNVSAPAIYVATPDGRITCIRHVEAGYLTVEDLRRDQGE
ncbi:MAG: PQQ-binding-like beta-propeller repeat protein [Phycisphaerae bacterium]